MKKLFTIFSFVLIIFSSIGLFAQNLQLPDGFTAAVVAEGLGGARHIAVTKQGNVYVKLSRLKDGHGIFYLKDMKDGKFSQQVGFGDYPGTGILIKGNYLYASSNEDVYRYQLNEKGEVIDPAKPEKIVTGLVNRKLDNSKSIALDNNGHLYVNAGSYMNACLIDPASKRAPNPCPLLDSVGGIWQFSANKMNQQYKDGVHYATGFKNTVGIDWNTQTNALYIMHHGRGDFNKFYPELFSEEQDKMLPAETMYEVHKGTDGGWPYEYYDQIQHKRMLAPEYGGDGKKLATHKAAEPVIAFPAHLGPNALLFYTGSKFPARYRNGAFIAFHGKSPELQKGYFVAFVPFKNGKPAGKWEPFADNFLINKDQHKPCGLAQGPDGSLYVSDDSNGSVYKIQYGK